MAHTNHVIVAEDDLGLNKLIQKNLRDTGYTVKGTTSGLETIEYTEQYQDCILVLDYSLADMKGNELIETLMSKQIDIPFIMMTANTDLQVVLEMMKLGAFDYIIKDSNLLELLPRTVNKVVDQLETRSKLTASLEEVKEGEKQYRELIELSPDAILVFHDTNILYSNHQGAVLFGETTEKLTGRSMLDFIDLRYKEDFKGLLEKMENDNMETESSFIQESFHRQDEQVRDIEVKATPISFNGQSATLAIIRDVTERRLTEESLQQSLQEIELLSSAVEKLTIGMVITDPNQKDNPIVYANSHFYELTGYSSEELIGQNCRMLQGEGTDPLSVRDIREAITNSEPISTEILNYRKDGSPFWNELQLTPIYNSSGDLMHYIGLQKDISDRKRAEEEIETMAYYDSLTELPNRRLFLDRLNQALNERIRDGQGLAVIMIDLDRFKIVNDSLGHYAGDIILQDLASRLNHHIRKSDTLARLGGDEFILLIPSITSTGDVNTICRHLQDAMFHPFHVEERIFDLSLSIGISTFPEGGANSNTLIKNADIAMYSSKEQGRNRYQWFTSSMDDMVIEKVNIETSIRKCLANDEFILHYQPKINLETGATYGVEALIRMPSYENGLIPPSSFIPLAEETGLIVSIGKWVLDTACKQNKAWQDKGFAPLRISVNISARQFLQEDIVEQVRQTLNDSGLEPKWLELELTESIIMRDLEDTAEKLQQLKKMGITISIDDFGTGFSSLSYLKNSPVDILKIDQSFLKCIDENDDTNEAIVRAIISLGQSLQMNVIAEGVETEGQLRFLKAEQCNSAQGYLFGVPCDAQAFGEFLKSKKQWFEFK
ncbi:EAL domain-containing protein [Halobacillus seohaensis]